METTGEQEKAIARLQDKVARSTPIPVSVDRATLVDSAMALLASSLGDQWPSKVGRGRRQRS